jgi:hypothetical protein
MRFFEWLRPRGDAQESEAEKPVAPSAGVVPPPPSDPEAFVEDDPTMTDALPKEDDETEGAA